MALYRQQVLSYLDLFYKGKKINKVACGSAHSLSWSTNKPVNAGRLPLAIPMEYNHLQNVPISTLRNRMVLLHHFSDLFCPSIPMIDLSQSVCKVEHRHSAKVDVLRGVLVSSAKVSANNAYVCIWWGSVCGNRVGVAGEESAGWLGWK